MALTLYTGVTIYNIIFKYADSIQSISIVTVIVIGLVSAGEIADS